MFTKNNVRKDLPERNNPNINHTELFYFKQWLILFLISRCELRLFKVLIQYVEKYLNRIFNRLSNQTVIARGLP
jgi:hypothetical protein